MCANQNSNFSLDLLCNFAKPNLSNWIVVPIFRLYNSGSPNPFFMEPSGIVISTLLLFGVAGSQCRNFVLMLLSGSSETKENVLGFNLSSLSVLKFSRCISR